MAERTRGAVALAAWLDAEQRSQQWLADQLEKRGFKCHQSTVSAWELGKWVPPTKAAVLLEELAGIQVAWWAEEVEPNGSLPSTGTG